MQSSKRKNSYLILDVHPEYEKKLINARVSLETVRMLNSLLEEYPHLFDNKSHVIEASIRRMYYYKRRGGR